MDNPEEQSLVDRSNFHWLMLGQCCISAALATKLKGLDGPAAAKYLREDFRRAVGEYETPAYVLKVIMALQKRMANFNTEQAYEMLMWNSETMRVNLREAFPEIFEDVPPDETAP